jgi:hypothetical protein
MIDGAVDALVLAHTVADGSPTLPPSASHRGHAQFCATTMPFKKARRTVPAAIAAATWLA